MRIDVYHHIGTVNVNLNTATVEDEQFASLVEAIAGLDGKLDALLTSQQAQTRQEATMSAQLDALKAQVAENTVLESSAVQLITGIAAQLASLKDDPVAIQALADSLKASATSLSAAITANTPEEPPVTP